MHRWQRLWINLFFQRPWLDCIITSKTCYRSVVDSPLMKAMTGKGIQMTLPQIQDAPTAPDPTSGVPGTAGVPAPCRGRREPPAKATQPVHVHTRGMHPSQGERSWGQRWAGTDRQRTDKPAPPPDGLLTTHCLLGEQWECCHSLLPICSCLLPQAPQFWRETELHRQHSEKTSDSAHFNYLLKRKSKSSKLSWLPECRSPKPQD